MLGLDNSFSNVSSTEELHEGIKHLVKALSDMFPVCELSLCGVVEMKKETSQSISENLVQIILQKIIQER